MAYATFAFAHSMTMPGVPPRILRSILEQGLSAFPGNATLLSLFSISEVRSNIKGNIRKFFNQSCRTDGSTRQITWQFAVHYELSRLRVSPEHCHIARVTTIFERALKCPVARHSTVLWFSYLRFCLQYADPMSAKRIFFRAIRACASSKRLWTEAMRDETVRARPGRLRALSVP